MMGEYGVEFDRTSVGGVGGARLETGGVLGAGY